MKLMILMVLSILIFKPTFAQKALENQELAYQKALDFSRDELGLVFPEAVKFADRFVQNCLSLSQMTQDQDIFSKRMEYFTDKAESEVFSFFYAKRYMNMRFGNAMEHSRLFFEACGNPAMIGPDYEGHDEYRSRPLSFRMAGAMASYYAALKLKAESSPEDAIWQLAIYLNMLEYQF